MEEAFFSKSDILGSDLRCAPNFLCDLRQLAPFPGPSFIPLANQGKANEEADVGPPTL